MDDMKNIVVGNEGDKNHDEGKTKSMNQSLDFRRYAFASAKPFQENKENSATIQRWKRKKIYHGQIRTQKSREF